MPALIGVLKDVSGSMQRPIEDSKTKCGENNWAASMLKVVEALTKQQLDEESQIFAYAYGGSLYGREVFDVIESLRLSSESTFKDYSTDKLCKVILDLLERNGAGNVKQWTDAKTLSNILKHKEALMLADLLRCDRKFAKKVVQEILPDVCKQPQYLEQRQMLLASSSKKIKTVAIKTTDTLTKYGKKLDFLPFSAILNFMMLASISPYVAWGLWTYTCCYLSYSVVHDTVFKSQEIVVNTSRSFVHAAKSVAAIGVKHFIGVEDVMQRVVGQIVDLGNEHASIKISRDFKTFSIGEARDVLEDALNDEEEHQIDHWMKLFEPAIYGQTPLMRAIKESLNKFGNPEFSNYEKVLIVLSDGQPSDGIIPPKEELEKLGVVVISCFITDDKSENQLHLYADLKSNWKLGSGLMWFLSSQLHFNQIPKSLFLKDNWRIDFKEHKTRLFLQINHPDQLQEVVDLAMALVFEQDVLANYLPQIDLDLYINRANDDFACSRQEGPECYAAAAASVFDLVMRDMGMNPDFFELRKDFVDAFGSCGNDVFATVKEMCQRYRLRGRELIPATARQTLKDKSPLLAWFKLTEEQWTNFDDFFKENPNGTLSINEIKQRSVNDHSLLRGQAFVLTGYDATSLRFLSARGSNFAQSGFFQMSIEDLADLNLMQVWYSDEDLTAQEFAREMAENSKKVDEMIKLMQGLKESRDSHLSLYLRSLHCGKQSCINSKS